MSGSYDFTLVQGEDFYRVITWSTSTVPVSQGGTPMDLTGCTASLSLGDTENFITSTPSGNGQVSVGGTDGQITISIPASVIAQFVDTAPYYRLFITSPASITACFLEGSIQVTP